MSFGTLLPVSTSITASNELDPWRPLTLLNGWVAQGGTSVGYYKDRMGTVHLRGTIDGTNATNTIVATIESNYQPLQTCKFPVTTIAARNDATSITVDENNGNITVFPIIPVGNGSWNHIGLDGIRYISWIPWTSRKIGAIAANAPILTVGPSSVSDNFMVNSAWVGTGEVWIEPNGLAQCDGFLSTTTSKATGTTMVTMPGGWMPGATSGFPVVLTSAEAHGIADVTPGSPNKIILKTAVTNAADAYISSLRWIVPMGSVQSNVTIGSLNPVTASLPDNLVVPDNPVAITLINGATGAGATGYGPPQYTVYMGTVYLSGCINITAFGSQATLPAAVRPTQQVTAYAASNIYGSNIMPYVQIDTAGGITPLSNNVFSGPSGKWFCLDGISYRLS